MKWLIVNADDFGASRGINRGIAATRRRGVLTSASLMVNRPAAEDAAALMREWPDLSVGLHLELEAGGEERLVGELDHQFSRFQELTGTPPTHLDSHHDVHRDPRMLKHVLAFARRYALPLRGYSEVRHLGKFYGQWGGETHPEQISVAGLTGLLDAEVEEGVTELCCHPGFVEECYPSRYAAERAMEVRTLCARGVRNALAERQIHLIGFRDLGTLVQGPREPPMPRSPRPRSRP